MIPSLFSRLPSLGVLTALLLPGPLPAQQLSIPGAGTDSAARSSAIARLAGEAAAAYRDTNRVVLLDNLFRLRLLSGRLAEADSTLADWRRAWAARGDTTARAHAINVQYEIYLRAKRLQADSGAAFPDAFARAFRERFARLDDRTAALVARTFNPPPPGPDAPARDTTMSVPDAVAWLRGVQVTGMYAELGRLAAPLLREDDGRRYAMESDIQVKTPDGATVCAMVCVPARARRGCPPCSSSPSTPIPRRSCTTCGATPRTATPAVMGLTRGKACSPDTPVPYVHDGADAAALIDWIARQPWSDGRVGMYGGSYSGMSPMGRGEARAEGAQGDHASARRWRPASTCRWKATSSWNFVYPWPFYTTNTKTLDNATYNDSARWRRLDNASGTRAAVPTATLDKIDGTPNPIWHAGSRTRTTTRTGRRMIPYGRGVRRHRHPGAPDRRLLLRRARRGALLLHRALPAQPACRALPGDRPVRPHPGAARRRDRAGRHGDG